MQLQTFLRNSKRSSVLKMLKRKVGSRNAVKKVRTMKIVNHHQGDETNLQQTNVAVSFLLNEIIQMFDRMFSWVLVFYSLSNTHTHTNKYTLLF